MRQFAVAIFASVWLFAVPADLPAQCVLCRAALVSSEEGQAMADKFNKGILFLLGAPFSVAAGIGIAMLRSRRRLRLSS